MMEEEAAAFMEAAAQMECGESEDGEEDAAEDTDGGDEPAANIGSIFADFVSIDLPL